MIQIYRWSQMERWDAFRIPHLHVAPHLPQLKIGELLTPVSNRVDRNSWRFEQLTPITIHFGGEISKRSMAGGTDYTMQLFWVRPGEVVLSKIDLKNGAVGVLEEGWHNVVVTSHFRVYRPDSQKLNARYFKLLLRTDDFKKWLWANRSGADGRTEVKLEVFEALEIPVPPLEQQAKLVSAYENSIATAEALVETARELVKNGAEAFEKSLGVVDPEELPERPVFVARFKDFERWSHEGVLRSLVQIPKGNASWPIVRLGDVVEDLQNGWSPQCHPTPAGPETWGVLKMGAVSFGWFDESQNKELPTSLKARPEYEVKAGDVLISRANVTRYVGSCAYVEQTREKLMLCDKIFRVRFSPTSLLLPRFLAEVMKMSTVREQIETSLTGTSPTMKNISKPSLLNLKFPLPDIMVQQQLVDALANARTDSQLAIQQATALRTSAWTAFESALFVTETLIPGQPSLGTH